MDIKQGMTVLVLADDQKTWEPAIVEEVKDFGEAVYVRVVGEHGYTPNWKEIR